MIVSLEVAEPPEVKETIAGVRDAVGPEGEMVAARFTVPAKPFWLVNVTVAFPDDPTTMLSEDWSRLIEKSGPTTVTETLAVWEFPPPEPVTETV